MASPTIEQIVEQIRTAVYGKDVRENIALGIEKCYEDVGENNLTKDDIVDDLNSTATNKVLSANQGRILKEHANGVSVEQIGLTGKYRLVITSL